MEGNTSPLAAWKGFSHKNYKTWIINPTRPIRRPQTTIPDYVQNRNHKQSADEDHQQGKPQKAGRARTEPPTPDTTHKPPLQPRKHQRRPHAKTAPRPHQPHGERAAQSPMAPWPDPTKPQSPEPSASDAIPANVQSISPLAFFTPITSPLEKKPPSKLYGAFDHP